MLDFDHLCGKKEPSVVAIVGGDAESAEILFRPVRAADSMLSRPRRYSGRLREKISWMLNLQSGRRAFDSTVAFFEAFPNALGGHLFAENIPEKHATELIERFGKEKLIAGPSGVGLLVSGHLKLGAIGGTDPAQIEARAISQRKGPLRSCRRRAA